MNLVFREQSAPEQSQPNDSPLLQLWSKMWSKNFRNFRWRESDGKTLDFAPKMQKIKPKTIRFRLYLVRVFITDLQKGGRTYSFRAGFACDTSEKRNLKGNGL